MSGDRRVHVRSWAGERGVGGVDGKPLVTTGSELTLVETLTSDLVVVELRFFLVVFVTEGLLVVLLFNLLGLGCSKICNK